MVAKCANPACNREFRELSKGRLFLLPPTGRNYSGATAKVERLSDYCYWLCPECDATHMIVRRESEVVVSVRGPGNPYSYLRSLSSQKEAWAVWPAELYGSGMSCDTL